MNGDAEGVRLGDFEDVLSLGEDVGFFDGCAVGPVLGCLLGEDVGVPGASVGFLLGDALG